MNQLHQKDESAESAIAGGLNAEAIGQTCRIRKVTEITGLSESTIYRLISAGKFPKPFKPSARINLWVIPEVVDYMKKLIKAR